MTWTYSGDPDSSVRDAVRFLVGDTDSTEQLLQDAEIDWVVTQSGPSPATGDVVYEAAHRCCHAIAGKFSREADKQIGDLRVSLSQRAKAYQSLAGDMKALALRLGNTPVPYAGGISISDKDIDRENTDLDLTWFREGQFVNRRRGSAKADTWSLNPRW